MSDMRRRGVDSLKFFVVMMLWILWVWPTKDQPSSTIMWIPVSIFSFLGLIILMIAIFSFYNVDITKKISPWLWERLMITTKKQPEKDRQSDKF